MDKKINQQLDQKLQQSYEQLSAKAPEGLWEQLQLHLPEVELDQQLDDKVQDSYEQLTVVAPTGVWESLEQALSEEEFNQQLEEKVQASYEQLSAVAPVGLWEGIEQTLPAVDIDQQLDEKLKEGFHQQATKVAPVALWSAISEELGTAASLDEQLDQKVKTSFTEEQPKAPHKVWTAVNRQLNIDRTWQRISAALDAPAQYIDWKLRTLQGLVLALLLLLWVRTCNKVPQVIDPSPAPIAVDNSTNSNSSLPISKDNQKQTINNSGKVGLEKQELGIAILEQQKDKNKENPTDNLAIGNGKNKSSTFSTPEKELESKLAVWNNTIDRKNEEELTANPLQQKNLTTNSVIPAHNNFVESKTTETKQNSIAALDEKNFIQEGQESNTQEQGLFSIYKRGELLSSKELAVLEMPIILPEELELAKEPSWKKQQWTPKNKLAIGVFIAVNSTALLNNETKEGFDYNSLTINYFGLAANYGLWARYRLGKRGALMAEYSLNADHRQAYGMYQKGKFAIKEYVFKYNRFSLAYQLDLWKDAQHPNNKITAQLGAYVGALRASQLYYNKVLVNDNIAEYHQYDGGLKLALGHEVAIDHFVIGYGIRSDIGLANIFKGNKKLDGQQNRTNLIHLGGYIHLGYQF